MKILYAIQGTGNGHISRSLEIIRYLKQFAHVDLLMSGPVVHQEMFQGPRIEFRHDLVASLDETLNHEGYEFLENTLLMTGSPEQQNGMSFNTIKQGGKLTPEISSVKELHIPLSLPYPVRFRKHGLSYISSSQGGVNFWQTYKYFKPFELMRDIATLPIERYDIIVSDCEPISAWACYKKKIPCIQVSNQASFFSPQMPRPYRKNYYLEAAMRYYIPHTHKIAFHYKPYDTFITTPIIKKELRQAKISDNGHITVYLPAYKPWYLAQHFMQIKQYSWHVYSPEIRQPYQLANIKFFPLAQDYGASILSSHAVVCAAGFQATAECLHLGKKMLVIPQHHQYEQHCNAAALEQLGCSVLSVIDSKFTNKLREWLEGDNAIQILFPDNAQEVAQKILTSSSF